MKFRASVAFSPLRGLLIIIILALAFLIPGPVLAQDTQPVSVTDVRVDIWPEYDKPSVLVIYNVTLASTVTFPVTLSLRIPAAAGKPFAVAWESPDNTLYDIQYDLQTQGEWNTITFSTPSPNVRLEYYDPSLQKDGTKRDFTFRWPGDYTVDNLSLQIQQPVNATGMTFTPDAGSGRIAEDGLTYYTLVAGKVPAGTTFELAMSYTKADDLLTSPNQFQPAQANQPVNNSTAGRVTLGQMLPWILGSLGLLLIAGGLFWYWRSGMVRKPSSASRPRHASSRAGSTRPSPAPRAPAAAAITADEESSFCQHCGKKAGPGDVFCRACGTRLK